MEKKACSTPFKDGELQLQFKMYSFNEIRVVFARCKDGLELEKACDALLLIIHDGDFSEKLEKYTRLQAHVRFRQLKV